jgi:ESCRT-II complex subunit VPS25
VSLSEVRVMIDWMAKGEEEGGGGKRAEWLPVGTPGASNIASIAGFDGVSSLMSSITGATTAVVSTAKTVAWIWWRRPEEWATLIADWVSFPMI